MRLNDLGEFGLIGRLTDGLERRSDVLLGVGDDAALLAPTPGLALVATCDAQVEGRHFLRTASTPREIGHKALAVNLSDIAAMGATPSWALVSLLLPSTLDVTLLDEVYAGMRALARRYDVAIVGGNISATDGPFTIDVTLLGQVESTAALHRSGGNPGDIVIVTGSLGGAAAGVLLALDANRDSQQAILAPDVLKRSQAFMAEPEPRVAEGRALRASGVVTAMADVSDGLLADLGHICSASGVGAILDAKSLPIDMTAQVIAPQYGRDPLSLALTGGEDYELVFTVRPDGVGEALEAVSRAGGTATVIGALTDAHEGLRLTMLDGTEQPWSVLKQRGWNHLQ